MEPGTSAETKEMDKSFGLGVIVNYKFKDKLAAFVMRDGLRKNLWVLDCFKDNF